MKATCLQENLAKGLAIVGRAVATRSTLPMASNILLASDGPRLKLSATNLEIGITTWVGAKVEEEGAVAVPARLLSEFVRLAASRQDRAEPGRAASGAKAMAGGEAFLALRRLFQVDWLDCHLSSSS